MTLFLHCPMMAICLLCNIEHISDMQVTAQNRSKPLKTAQNRSKPLKTAQNRTIAGISSF